MTTLPDARVKLLVVEDDMIIAANISLQLTNLGYEVTGIESRGEAVVHHVEANRPDIVLLDINLRGSLDGIDTAHAIQQFWDIPIIYVTANTDAATFDRAKETRPHAFIVKPIKNVDLQRAIELVISRMEATHLRLPDTAQARSENALVVLSDRIFVRHKDKMVKIVIDDILYLEADRNYCHVFTTDREYLLATTLKAMEDKLSARQFVRVHRSFVVNLRRVDEVSETHVGLAGKTIPLSHLLRDDLLQRIQMI
jgi:DNA-binding LytR/AlgR family response regulator